MAKAFSREPPHLAIPRVEEAQPATPGGEPPLVGQASSRDAVTVRASPRHKGIPRVLRRGLGIGGLGLLTGAVLAGALWLKSEPPAPALEPEVIPMAASERPPEAAPASEALALTSGATVGGMGVSEGAAPAVEAQPPPSEARVPPPSPEPSRAEAAPARKRQAEVVSLAEGRRLFHDGKYEQARSVLKKAVAAEPGNAMAHLLLGRTYRKLGDASLASKHLRRFQELTPGHREDAWVNRMIENMRRVEP
jgi:hypothetical protein